MTCIEERFNRTDYQIYQNCDREQLLCKAAHGEDYTNEFKKVTDFYGDNFKPARLDAHLKTFGCNFPKEDLSAKPSFRNVLVHFSL